MSLYEILSKTVDLEKLAYEAASLLQDKTEVPTKEEGKLFKYPWIKECSNLVREFSRTKVYTEKTKYQYNHITNQHRR